MACRKIPAWPKGVSGSVWGNKLAHAAVYAVESDLLNYDTGTSALVFAIPDDTILLGAGIEVVTAFTGATTSTKVTLTDSASNTLAFWGDSVLDGAGFSDFPGVLRRYAKTAAAGNAGKRSKVLEVDVATGGASAGTFRLWIKIKPDRSESLRKDFVGTY